MQMANENKQSLNMCKPKKPANQKRYRVIACEIYFREICKLASECENLLDIEFLRKGLHDIETKAMQAELQKAIDDTEPGKYDAILLAYGRCNNGVAGLYTKDSPLVIPRSHDCIGVFMGGCSKYREYFDQHPGTFYRTSGWTERDYVPQDSLMNNLGLNLSRQEIVDKYGEENAQYIMDTMGNWSDKYQYLAYIDMGLDIDKKYAELAKEEAEEKGLEYITITGDLSLLKNLLDGRWDEKNFVVVEASKKLITDETGNILTTESL